MNLQAAAARMHRSRPWEDRQAQLDRGGIKRIGGMCQLDIKGLVDIEATCRDDQTLREFGVDAPVALLVGIGQRAACDMPTNPQVIKLGLMRAQTDLDIAQTFTSRELSEGHAQELDRKSTRLNSSHHSISYAVFCLKK